MSYDGLILEGPTKGKNLISIDRYAKVPVLKDEVTPVIGEGAPTPLATTVEEVLLVHTFFHFTVAGKSVVRGYWVVPPTEFFTDNELRIRVLELLEKGFLQ